MGDYMKDFYGILYGRSLVGDLYAKISTNHLSDLPRSKPQHLLLQIPSNFPRNPPPSQPAPSVPLLPRTANNIVTATRSTATPSPTLRPWTNTPFSRRTQSMTQPQNLCKTTKSVIESTLEEKPHSKTVEAYVVAALSLLLTALNTLRTLRFSQKEDQPLRASLIHQELALGGG